MEERHVVHQEQVVQWRMTQELTGWVTESEIISYKCTSYISHSIVKSPFKCNNFSTQKYGMFTPVNTFKPILQSI